MARFSIKYGLERLLGGILVGPTFYKHILGLVDLHNVDWYYSTTEPGIYASGTS